MSEPVFNQGDLIPISVSWAVDGVAADPDDLYLALEIPGQSEVIYHYGAPDGTIVRTGVGAYQYKSPGLDSGPAAGRYQGKWFATGYGQGTAEFSVYVTASNVTMTPVP